MELDRISGLPNDVTEKILSCMPLREAVRTSVLSRKWRYKSDMLQDLVFDDQCVSTQSHPTYSFENIVDHVLLLHTGPIHKFKLSRNDEVATKHMDRWIFHLSRNPVVKEMIINIWQGDPYNIPSCLFSHQDIVYLELYRCLLNPPSSFKGFRNLKSLDIWSVNLAQNVLENLIGGSPLLEMLGLRHCDGFTNLKIDAPNLRIVDIIGVFEDVNLENTSNLAQVSIEWTENVDQRRGPASSGNLLNFFDRQPHIQRLTINRNFLKVMDFPGRFINYLTIIDVAMRIFTTLIEYAVFCFHSAALQYLSIGALPEKLPKPCHYLNFLSVHMSFDVSDEILTVLCLLRSSPALQELDISVDTDKDHAAVGEVKFCLYDSYNCAYTQLRLLKMTDISGLKAELDFIKFLLLSSPALERMTVKPSVNCSSELVKELLRLRRVSMLAEIIYLDP